MYDAVEVAADRLHDLPGRLLLSLALIRDLPQEVVVRPRQICHLDNDLRAHPVNARERQR